MLANLEKMLGKDALYSSWESVAGHAMHVWFCVTYILVNINWLCTEQSTSKQLFVGRCRAGRNTFPYCLLVRPANCSQCTQPS